MEKLIYVFMSLGSRSGLEVGVSLGSRNFTGHAGYLATNWWGTIWRYDGMH